MQDAVPRQLQCLYFRGDTLRRRIIKHSLDFFGLHSCWEKPFGKLHVMKGLTAVEQKVTGW